MIPWQEGATVYAVKRDYRRRPKYTYKYVFLAQSGHMAVVASDVNKICETYGVGYFRDIIYKENLEDHFSRCQLIPMEDLYSSEEQAKRALERERMAPAGEEDE